MKERFDIHQHITDRIVSAIEANPGEWQMPWHRGTGGRWPVNIATGNRYRGINTLALWVEAQAHGFGSHIWGTYRQWAEKGRQVRKAQKASYVVFYKEIDIDPANTDENAPEKRMFARATPVFNADQVDGEPPAPDMASLTPAEINDQAETFVSRTGAVIQHGGHRACFNPKTDEIHMPPREIFVGSTTSSATEAYYSTLLHELTHWTGVESRCNREMGKRFGSEAYAMEELVAELGAAFLCSELNLTAQPRADHAQYLAHWLQVLKSDNRAIFTAASKASQAVTFLSSSAASSE